MNLTNKNINKFINSKYNNYKILYHITTYKNAINIIKNNFDIKKSITHAFGKGINMTDNIKHLSYYYNKNNVNTIVISLVKYNKLKYNPSYYNNIDSEKSKEYIEKYGFSRPKYLVIPKNYDGFINDDIYVIKNKKLIFPLFITKYIHFNKK